MLLLAKNELKLHQGATESYICRKKVLKEFADDKDYRKAKNHCQFRGKYKGAAHII